MITADFRVVSCVNMFSILLYFHSIILSNFCIEKCFINKEHFYLLCFVKKIYVAASFSAEAGDIWRTFCHYQCETITIWQLRLDVINACVTLFRFLANGNPLVFTQSGIVVKVFNIHFVVAFIVVNLLCRILLDQFNNFPWHILNYCLNYCCSLLHQQSDLNQWCGVHESFDAFQYSKQHFLSRTKIKHF